VLPRRTVTYRGARLEELDVDAVLARRPQGVVVDELAHTNAPGSRNGKRWQDVEELLAAGVEVLTTVNVQHLESLNDVVATTLIRRAARIAARNTGADLLAVHVTRSDGLTDTNPATLSRQRTLVEALGGTYHHVVGDDIPTALLTFARAENATQLVLGASRRGRLARLLSPGIGVTVTARSGSIDVHMVTHAQAAGARARLPRLAAASPCAAGCTARPPR
jgi:K+-sensing histidine kinase KdpD